MPFVSQPLDHFPPRVYWMLLTAAFVFGCCVGSYLNVVIHRLPKMMELRWASECAEFNRADAAPSLETPAEPFNLVVPRSRCPHCGHHCGTAARPDDSGRVR